MINPKELRLGNIVLFEGKPVVIEAINSEEGHEHNLYEPMPITEQVLVEQLGFMPTEKPDGRKLNGFYDHSFMTDHNGNWVFRFMFHDTAKGDGSIILISWYEDGQDNGHGVNCIYVNSVHKIQNAYYAVTNEELKPRLT